MNIVVVGDFEPGCGCSEIMIGYKKAALAKGISISTSGYVDERLRKDLSYVENPTGSTFDRVFYLFEDICYLDPKKYPMN